MSFQLLVVALLCPPVAGSREMPVEALGDLRILCVKRSWPETNIKKTGPNPKAVLQDLGFPANHLSMSSLNQTGYENEIGVFEPATGNYTTLYRPEHGGWVGQIDLHWDGERFLFAKGDSTNWKIFEMRIDGSGLRQVSHEPDDVDCYEPCYLPDGRIVFASNAAMQCIPCWHGVEDRYAANLYVMNADGTNMRRLTFDQDHNTSPVVRHNGQVMYGRWDYTGINRLYNRPLMAMNPDGTSQRAVYGSNSWFPNGLYGTRELPGRNGQFLSVIAGYHGSYRSGSLAIIDINKGTREAEGIVRFVGSNGHLLPTDYRDRWSEPTWPEYVTPYPLSDEVYLASAWNSLKDRKIGLYLLGHDNKSRLLIEEDGQAFLEPVPVKSRPMPPVLPGRTIPDTQEATVYIQDIHAGPGLKGVPRGTVSGLRVISYDFGYSGMAGMDKIGLSGPWEAVRILGTTPVEDDGSAIFKVPANTPIALQPLDKEGKAVQLMRTWMTAMPGEVLSCVGCHESTMDAPVPRRTIASGMAPKALKEWHGPARGFDFAREVQPVLNRYCVSCHDGSGVLDLRPEEQVDGYAGRVPGRFDRQRMHPYHKEHFDNRVYYTPAYEALLPYIRRVSIGDDVSLLEPGEYHADTSELIQVLQDGHYGIEMDDESWSRLVTWIDLNGPCHGTWEDVYDMPVPGRPDLRRKELAERYGGPPLDPDIIPDAPVYDETPVTFESKATEPPSRIHFINAPSSLRHRAVDLGNGVSVDLVNYGQSIWMSATEITNEQFARFDPGHSSRYYVRRFTGLASVGRGMPFDQPGQPVLRVSWDRAMAFCEWLSELSGLEIRLPTEDEWESACLAGSSGPFCFSGDDFSPYENLADYSFANVGYRWEETAEFTIATDCEMLMLEGVDLADQRFDDKAVVTRPVGSYLPNSFGLFDMHGNVAEWTLTDSPDGEKIVKGGSFLDRPARAGVDQRRSFPAWQNVHNVGFRIVAGETSKIASK